MKVVKNLILILIILFTLISVLSAHIHWIIPSQININKNTEIKICSGHDFPESDFAIDKKLIYKMHLYTGLKKNEIKKNIYHEKFLSFNPLLKNIDTTIIEVQLKKPVVKKLFFYLRYIYPMKNDNKKKYVLKNGLEIIPLKKITKIKKHEKVPFQILYNGKPVKGTITVQTKDGVKYWSTDKDGISKIKIKQKGYFLFSAKYRGTGCSLVIYIQ